MLSYFLQVFYHWSPESGDPADHAQRVCNCVAIGCHAVMNLKGFFVRGLIVDQFVERFVTPDVQVVDIAQVKSILTESTVVQTPL